MGFAGVPRKLDTKRPWATYPEHCQTHYSYSEMITVPFLTDLDSRAAVKGSRDPLGIQSIWTRFGRHVVGNLSTVSNSVRDFTIAILGHYFAEQVAEAVGPGTELDTFLKWEQLAGYARSKINDERGFRGVERVQQNLQERSVTLSASSRHQILSSQKLYGIWGLYTVPARSSGLLEGTPARLTSPARDLVREVYFPKLAETGFREGKAIVDLLKKETIKLDTDGADRGLLVAVAGLLKSRFSAREREFYRYHLLYGGPHDETEGRQRQLVGFLEPRLSQDGFAWCPDAVRALAKEARTADNSSGSLEWYLNRIAAAETVLAPASEFFGYLLGCHDTGLGEIAKDIEGSWGGRVSTVAIEEFEALEPELADGDKQAGKRWVGIANALACGEYEMLIRLLVAQNEAVMRDRGGAGAWIEIRNGKLHVRLSDEHGNLPEKEDLPRLWRFPYFLNSLSTVALALKEDRHG